MTTFQGLYQDILSQVSRTLYAMKMLILGHLTPDLIPLPEARLALTQLHTKLQEYYDTYTTPIRTPQQFYQNTEFYMSLLENTNYMLAFSYLFHTLITISNYIRSDITHIPSLTTVNTWLS